MCRYHARWLKAVVVIFGRTNNNKQQKKHRVWFQGHHRAQRPGAGAHPWNLNHTPAASSGGSAAAVPLASCRWRAETRLGGSIRCPPGIAELFGIKNPDAAQRLCPSHYEAIHGASINQSSLASLRDSAAMPRRHTWSEIADALCHLAQEWAGSALCAKVGASRASSRSLSQALAHWHKTCIIPNR